MDLGELSHFMGAWLPRVEQEMKDVLSFPLEEQSVSERSAIYGMMHYHMGWADESLMPQQMSTGKRLRPIFCLLACAELGGDPAKALPAAAAVEILHNFSLVHDDIEDGDEMRRHRPTMWRVWGIPQAINAGDGMFALAFAALQRLPRMGVSADMTLKALELFIQTCTELTEGQYLDMHFEEQATVQVGEYMSMIEGKTASLIGTSVALGALIADGTSEQQEEMQRFGQSVGLEFQIQDDILGIWGDPDVTGKAAGNDILKRKKSLPLLYALNHPDVGEELQEIWAGEMTAEKLTLVMNLLTECQAYEFAQAQRQFHHENAARAIDSTLSGLLDGSALWLLADSLRHRTA